ncbi:phosphoribosylamine--glycine ligase [bacterium CPR1]|nr:phosphoribosylamine--glycine ligase [bacterium CPR1]
MKVLLVGGGGREHALAWKLVSSPLLDELVVTPGNAGTRLMAGQPLPAARCRLARVLALGRGGAPVRHEAGGPEELCRRERFDLVVVGPEAPLAAGLADRLEVPVFGPSQRAAEIESSKSFSKDFMLRHGIPTARHRSFTDLEQARAHVTGVDYPVVLKASGLAAGKGVLLPEPGRATLEALQGLMQTEAGHEVVIEERLEGREVSLMGFCDGERVLPMRAVRDHKRLLDGDRGPNTGGMGAVSLEDEVGEWCALALEPAVRGLKAEGRPFVGVLYAGLMLTPDGLRVLEYNCRFGDPETQVLMALLESDLLEVCLACARGRLEEARFGPGQAACVVMAAQGYPDTPRTGDAIDLGADNPDSVVFHAGTKLVEDRILTAGGRVLGVTGLGSGLEQALANAYRRVGAIHFEGAHYRSDIGRTA